MERPIRTRHHFTRTDQSLYTDQHGCVGVLSDGRPVNGMVDFHWDHKIFALTPAEAEKGFVIREYKE